MPSSFQTTQSTTAPCIIMSIKNISAALLYALWLEFFYKFGATHDPANFIGSIPIYCAYLILLSLLIKILRLQNRIVIPLLLCGAIGLMAEWFIIGNAPWTTPEALQIGMFIFHAAYPVIGLIILPNKKHTPLFKKITALFAIFTLIASAGFIIPHPDLRFAWFIWIPLAPYFIAAGLMLSATIKR